MGQLAPLQQGVWLSANKSALLIATDNPENITKFYQERSYKVIEKDSKYYVAVPFTFTTLSTLYNIGIPVQNISIVRHRYTLPKVKGESPLGEHQILQAEFFCRNQRAFCTSTMRTGKTAAAIVAARTLQLMGAASAFIILAPKTVLYGTWVAEIQGLYPDAIVVNVGYGEGSAKRRALFNRQAHFYIMNYDALKALTGEVQRRIEAGYVSGIIIDESNHYGNYTSARWKVADAIVNGVIYKKKKGKATIIHGTNEVVKEPDKYIRVGTTTPVTYCWGMTGTPGDEKKVYSQSRLVTPTNMPISARVWIDLVTYPAGPFKRKPRECYEIKMAEALQPCYRVDKKDIYDLPPVVDSEHVAPLTKEQRKIIDNLMRDLVYEDSSTSIVASNQAVVALKIMQVALGAVNTDKGVVPVDATPRIELLKELISQSETGKVVIFSSFKQSMYTLAEQLKPYKCAIINGDVRRGDVREQIIKDFNKTKTYDVVICHPRTTAYGVDFAAADMIIFNGPVMAGAETYQQARERIQSLHQKAASCQIVHVSATEAEKNVFKRVSEGANKNDAIQEAIKGMMEEFA